MSKWIQENRPILHFAPKNGWINDPNGLVYDGKQYHLFAQHNPHAAVWGPMHWLHAVSDDLFNWQELGIALYPNDLGTIFSGSAVIDANNTAGFGHGAMIAVYTQHGDQERQSIAYSIDGVTFTPYAGNPVIENPGIADFRDPKVFWHEKSQCWVMALAARECIAFYRSKDIRTWEKTGTFTGHKDKYGDIFECPDLFSLTAPDGTTVWVLLVSMTASAQAGGSRMQYYLGEFDDETFHPLQAQPEAYMVDAGVDDYAGVTYAGLQEKIYTAWAASPSYAGKVPAGNYRGCMTLPRKLTLVDTPAGIRLAAEPLLDGLLARPAADDALPTGAYAINIQANGPFEIQLTNSLGEIYRFGLDENDCIYSDRTKAGAADFDANYPAPLYSTSSIKRLFKGTLKMQLIVDHTLLETYADMGTYVNSALVFPQEKYTKLSCKGDASIKIAGLTKA